MNASQRNGFPSRRISACSLIAAMCFGFAVMPATAGVQDSTKTYTLFMGANISVGQGSDLHPVRDVSGGSWVIGVNGEPVRVSAKNGPINMKVAPTLKLTETSAIISKLKSERAYTFANDPSVRLTRSLNQSADLNAGNHAAVNQATAAQTNAVSAVENGLGTTPGNTTPAAAALHDAAVRDLVNSEQHAVDSASNSAGSDLFYKGSDKDTENYDALDVSFEVSAEKHLGEPYIVMITRFHERGAGAGTSRNLVYAKALNPIGPKATKVHVEQAGLPPGYELQSFEIHLYNHGDEVATNVAAKREEFTSDEAFEYVKTKYVGAHKGETLPAVPVMIGKLPSDLPERLTEGKYSEIFFVRVSKDGLADEPFVDAACSKRIEDPYLESIVRSVRFEPALVQGRPAEGIAPLNLSQLRI